MFPRGSVSGLTRFGEGRVEGWNEEEGTKGRLLDGEFIAHPSFMFFRIMGS